MAYLDQSLPFYYFKYSKRQLWDTWLIEKSALICGNVIINLFRIIILRCYANYICKTKAWTGGNSI